jgi:hypothetical protein
MAYTPLRPRSSSCSHDTAREASRQRSTSRLDTPHSSLNFPVKMFPLHTSHTQPLHQLKSFPLRTVNTPLTHCLKSSPPHMAGECVSRGLGKTCLRGTRSTAQMRHWNTLTARIPTWCWHCRRSRRGNSNTHWRFRASKFLWHTPRILRAMLRPDKRHRCLQDTEAFQHCH